MNEGGRNRTHFSLKLLRKGVAENITYLRGERRENLKKARKARRRAMTQSYLTLVERLEYCRELAGNDVGKNRLVQAQVQQIREQIVGLNDKYSEEAIKGFNARGLTPHGTLVDDYYVQGLRDCRREARYLHLADAYLKNRSYSEVEVNPRFPVDAQELRSVVVDFGPTTTVDAIKEWLS